MTFKIASQRLTEASQNVIKFLIDSLNCNAPRGVFNDPETSYSTKISKRVEALNYQRKQSTSQVDVIKQIVYYVYMYKISFINKKRI